MNDYDKYLNSLMFSRKKFPYNILEFPRDLIDSIKEYFHYKKYGFKKCEVWNLNYSLALWILPRLKHFKNVNNCIPREVCKKYYKDDYKLSEENEKKAIKEWDDALNCMIEAFEILVDEDIDIDFIKEYEKEKNKVDKGLKLFVKYFNSLWW